MRGPSFGLESHVSLSDAFCCRTYERKDSDIEVLVKPFVSVE